MSICGKVYKACQDCEVGADVKVCKAAACEKTKHLSPVTSWEKLAFTLLICFKYEVLSWSCTDQDIVGNVVSSLRLHKQGGGSGGDVCAKLTTDDLA